MDVAIRSGREKPWLSRMEHRCQDAKFLYHLMASQNLDRYQKRIPHQVRVYHGMVNIDSAIVGRGCHQRVTIVERGRADSTLVVFEGFIRRIAKVQVEPNQSTIETANNHMVTRRVNINGRNPSAAREQTFHHGLLDEVVYADMLRGRDEQKWLVRVEACALNVAALGSLAKGLLRTGFAELVNQDRSGSSLGANCNEVITLAMPANVGYLLVRAEKTDGTRDAAKGADGLRRG